MGGDLIFSALVIKRQSLILFLLRLPAFIPWIFVARGWLSLNEKDSLTNTEADILQHHGLKACRFSWGCDLGILSGCGQDLSRFGLPEGSW
jgi:hypothetical protein